MACIKDLWILLFTGEVLFDRLNEQQVDPYIFGAMLSALHTYSEKILDGSLTSFEFGDTCYSILKKKTILFVAKCSRDIGEEKITEELNKMSEKFFTRYSDEYIENWNANPNKFDSFGEDVEEFIIKSNTTSS